MSRTAGSTRIGVDVGGTFTDAVLVTAAGGRTTAKVPTTEPPDRGVIRAIERACTRAGVPPDGIETFRHGTTVATNALLARSGGVTALVTTEGFRDVLEIGRQTRPALYDLWAERSPPLVPRRRRFELAERQLPPTHSEGSSAESAPTEAAIERLVEELEGTEVDAVAISFLHAYANADHERAVRTRMARRLDVPVVASSDVLPEIREYERTATTVASAYLAPIVDEYLDRLASECQDQSIPPPAVMRSNGGVASFGVGEERSVAMVLSGPAAGVVGARARVDRLDHLEGSGAITFDMGGTSADVGLVREDGIEHTTETTVGGVPIKVPTVDIRTVGAGGGSIAWLDDGRALRVGPDSAGAEPGPACYGRGGGRPTVTDAAVVLGIIGPEATLGGDISIDSIAAEEAMSTLAARAELGDPTEAALGVIRVANATMTRAIRSITVERGYDPRTHTLVAFGGAGGMHAAGIADRLDIGEVVIPPAGGVLSAAGLLHADERHDVGLSRRYDLTDATDADLAAIFDRLEADARQRCSHPEAAHVDRAADLRYVGQSFELTVPIDGAPDPDVLVDRFHRVHDRRRGYRLDEAVEGVTWRAIARIPAAAPPPIDPMEIRPTVQTRDVTFLDGETQETTVYRGPPPRSERLSGPCIVERRQSTVLVPPGWNGRRRDPGDLVLREDDS